jgi:ATP-binding cassette subfamily C protein
MMRTSAAQDVFCGGSPHGSVAGSYVVVAILLLLISPLLAVVVLVGVPLIAVTVGPALHRLLHAGMAYREHQGELTARLVDVVSGLGVLGSIGGKQAVAGRYHRDSQTLREQGYQVGAMSSWIGALGVGLPALFLAVVTWLAARLAAAGSITIGHLVAVYGYVAMLVVPVSSFIEGGRDIARALVAARRAVQFLSLKPDHADRPGALGGPAPGAVLQDPASGVDVRPHALTVLASARHGEGVTILNRLGRFTDSQVTWGGVPLDSVSIGQVRERILMADNDAGLFAGSVRDVVAGRNEPDDGMIRAAIEAAVATDIVEALPDGAVLALDPLLGLCGLVCPAIIAVVLRWYLRRARSAYLAEGAANSALAEMLTATASGARTVEALGLQESRRMAAEAAIAAAREARLRTLGLRTVLFPTVDISYVVSLVAVLLAGGALYFHHAVTLGAVVAAALYLRQMAGPLDDTLIWAEQLQSSGASYARVEGLAGILPARAPDGAEPAGDRIDVTGVYYAYGHGRNVLHDVSLLIHPGERLAIVGPSGAGKSTLGRLLAGVDKPRWGTVTMGGVPLASLSPERLRRRIVLVTQEHHVFRDTLRDNLLLAKPDTADPELLGALEAVGAGWVADLPHGLDTELGTDRHRLNGAQAEQLALARVVLADPHTLVLDEATALLDPATARNTEQALARVLQGRTVIAIAHRLQTARDADRVAVMNAGTITEIGTHDELVATGGGYAALWQSWHGEPAGTAAAPERGPAGDSRKPSI